MGSQICVMGMGYVGLTLSVVLAEVGYDVWGIEIDKGIVKKLNKGEPHFFEKNLAIRLKHQVKAKRLHFVTKAPCIPFSVIIISVGTPLKMGTKVPDLSYIDQVVADVAELIQPGCLVCMRSTVPVGLTRSKVLPVLEEKSGLKVGTDFYLAFTPERTLEGNALQELRENPQVIGGITEKGTEKAASFFLKVTPTVVNVSSIEVAEFAKIIDNTFRDIRFSFANEMALISEHLGLDINEVIHAANIHYPRNNIPIPSPGVGGACLSKDPHILIDLAEKAGYHPRLIAEARRINEGYPSLIVERIQETLKKMGKELDEANVLITGFAFKGKPETADLRDSTSLWLLRELKSRSSCVIRGYDPIVEEAKIRELGIEIVTLPDGFKKIDVLIIANNHESYKDWDINDLISKLNKPAIIYDAWRMLDKEIVESFEGTVYLAPGL